MRTPSLLNLLSLLLAVLSSCSSSQEYFQTPNFCFKIQPSHAATVRIEVVVDSGHQLFLYVFQERSHTAECSLLASFLQARPVR